MADEKISAFTQKDTFTSTDYVGGYESGTPNVNYRYSFAALNYVVTDTQRSFAKPQWIDVTALTPASNIFTPDLETTAGSYTANVGANSTLANPIIPSGYSTGHTLAWDLTLTFTGAGGWTFAFDTTYRVDDGVDIAAIIADNNTTGDVIQLFFIYKNGVNYLQYYIPATI